MTTRGTHSSRTTSTIPQQVEYLLQLWQPTALDGTVVPLGGTPLGVPSGRITRKWPSDGGFLAQYLLPHVTQRERAVNASATGAQAWGWLPPPLGGEGRKVQPGWLYEFLLDPRPIRPAALLPMPRFNLSRREAAQLVDFFAALDQAQTTRTSLPRRAARSTCRPPSSTTTTCWRDWACRRPTGSTTPCRSSPTRTTA